MTMIKGKPIKIAYIKPPCFDSVTKTDCPRRCVGCAETCPDWAEYIKKRDDVYEKRIVNSRHKSMYGRSYKQAFDRYIKFRKRGRK